MLAHRSARLELTRLETQHPPARTLIHPRGSTHSGSVRGFAAAENPAASSVLAAVHAAGPRQIRICVHPEKPTNPFRPLTFAQLPVWLSEITRSRKPCETSHRRPRHRFRLGWRSPTTSG